MDAVIALSVCYKGFDNNEGFKNYLGVPAPNLLWMVFAFGLVHGFGLSTRLQQLPLGEKGMGFLGRIIAFNVGVEVGQVAALLIMLVLLNYWRQRPSFQKLSRACNDGLVLAGLLLFAMQMHGYLHGAYPEEFGFNADGHAHAHEDMESSDTNTSHDNIEGNIK